MSDSQKCKNRSHIVYLHADNYDDSGSRCDFPHIRSHLRRAKLWSSGGIFGNQASSAGVCVKLPPEVGKNVTKILRLAKTVYGLKSSGCYFIQSLFKNILEFTHRHSSCRKSFMDQCSFVFEGEEDAISLEQGTSEARRSPRFQIRGGPRQC